MLVVFSQNIWYSFVVFIPYRRTSNVDVEVKAPGYQPKHPSRHESRLTAREVLLGATSHRLSSSSSEETSSDEDQNDASAFGSEGTEDEESSDVVKEESGENSADLEENVENSIAYDANTDPKEKGTQKLRKLSRKLNDIRVDNEEVSV